MPDAITLIETALDQGDALVTALRNYDLGGAETAMASRQETLDVLFVQEMPASLPPNLMARFRTQNVQIQATLSEHLRTSQQAATDAARSLKANDRYQQTAEATPPRFDSDPR